jgi:leader peptidase (prepilin peptidase)/N-methyltransferase
LGLEPLIITFLILLGMAFGSFFNVVIYRLPLNKSLIPSSKCPKCDYAIPAWLNVPIFSWLFLKGKCKNCGAKISWHYVIVELLTPLIYLLVYWRFGAENPVLLFKYLIFFSYGIIIIFIDLYHMRIPFKLSIPLNILGLISLIIPGNEVPLFMGLLGGAGSFLFFVALMLAYYYIRGREGLGFGDVLLISAIGFFTGIYSLVIIVAIASFLGLIIMSIFMKYRKDKLFPFGPFLIIAAWFYLVWGYKLFDLYLNYLNSLM